MSCLFSLCSSHWTDLLLECPQLPQLLQMSLWWSFLWYFAASDRMKSLSFLLTMLWIELVLLPQQLRVVMGLQIIEKSTVVSKLPLRLLGNQNQSLLHRYRPSYTQSAPLLLDKILNTRLITLLNDVRSDLWLCLWLSNSSICWAKLRRHEYMVPFAIKKVRLGILIKICVWVAYDWGQMQ